MAAHVHKWSGYETDFRSDGQLIDKQTGFPVAGVKGSGLSPEQYNKAMNEANTLVTVTDTEGHPHNIATWQAAKMNGMPVSSAADYIQQNAQASDDIAKNKQKVQNHLNSTNAAQQVQRGVVPSTLNSPAAQVPGQPQQQPGQSGAPTTRTRRGPARQCSRTTTSTFRRS